MNDRPKYIITVEAQSDEVPPIHRLRSWLKSGLRAFKLRCVEAVEVMPPASESGDAPKPTSRQ